MNDSIVRVRRITINDVKNTKHGTVYMPLGKSDEIQSSQSEILGIYGQNGSGKTSIIDVLDIVRQLFMGRSLLNDVANLINVNEKACSIEAEFSIETNNTHYIVQYLLDLQKEENTDVIEYYSPISDNPKFKISQEKIKFSIKNKDKKISTKPLLIFSCDDADEAFLPKNRYDNYKKREKELMIAKGIARKENKSYIFNNDCMSVLAEYFPTKSNECAEILTALRNYSKDLFVIKTSHSGAISAASFIPFAFSLKSETGGAFGDLAINLSGPSIIKTEHLGYPERIINAINIVLGKIISGLALEIAPIGTELSKDGSTSQAVELLSVRDNTKIPLKFESEGIIKLVSILQVFICAYNNPTVCLVVDELDAGIYEYLLGELLKEFQESGKGQLIFTSHNLRPLEMLDKSNIMFSTANPENRFISLKNVQKNNNLRDMYIRSVTLGGQDEELYVSNDTFEISRAFRKAGKEMQKDE